MTHALTGRKLVPAPYQRKSRSRQLLSCRKVARASKKHGFEATGHTHGTKQYTYVNAFRRAIICPSAAIRTFLVFCDFVFGDALVTRVLAAISTKFGKNYVTQEFFLAKIIAKVVFQLPIRRCLNLPQLATPELFSFCPSGCAENSCFQAKH
jgi:hypothetical protein